MSGGNYPGSGRISGIQNGSMKIFAEKSREERIRRGVTQTALSEKSQTTDGAVFDRERGRFGPSPEIPAAIEKYPGVSVDYLLGSGN